MFSLAPGRLRGTLSLWLVLFVVWSAANGTLAIDVAVFGLVVTFFIAFSLTRSALIWNDLSFTPGRGLAFLRYTAVFLREMVKSNLKVLGYVYAPRIKIRPGIVRVQTRLTSPFARFVLCNTVTLTPGTLVLGLQDQSVYVHGLDLDTTDPDANVESFLGPFEPILARTFG